jgi:molecular chaperone GrpE
MFAQVVVAKRDPGCVNCHEAKAESLYGTRMSNLMITMAQNRKGPVTQLKEQLDEKSSSCKKLQEEYLRAIADFDNLRKRNERDSEISRRMALEALLLDLVPVLDNFERAMQVAQNGAPLEGLQKGMDLIHKQLREALCKHGLQEYSCVGTQFDPRKAEAISFLKTDEHTPGTVMSEVCKGYSCGQRVLRPARVVVAKELDRAAGQEKAEAGTPGKDGADGGSQPEGRSPDPGAERQQAEESDAATK